MYTSPARNGKKRPSRIPVTQPSPFVCRRTHGIHKIAHPTAEIKRNGRKNRRSLVLNRVESLDTSTSGGKHVNTDHTPKLFRKFICLPRPPVSSATSLRRPSCRQPPSAELSSPGFSVA